MGERRGERGQGVRSVLPAGKGARPTLGRADCQVSAGDFLHFLHEHNSEPHAGTFSTQRIIRADSHAQNANLLRACSQKDNYPDRLRRVPVLVVGEEGLNIMVAVADRKATRPLLQPRVPKALERVNNSLPHFVLARIEKKQLLQAFFAGCGSPR